MKGLNPIILLQGSFSDQNLYLLFCRMTVHSPCKIATYPALDNPCATRLPLTQHLQLSDMQLLRSFSYAVFLTFGCLFAYLHDYAHRWISNEEALFSSVFGAFLLSSEYIVHLQQSLVQIPSDMDCCIKIIRAFCKLKCRDISFFLLIQFNLTRCGSNFI